MRYLKVYLPVVILSLMSWACESEEQMAGDKYFNQKDYEKAIEAYTTHLETSPNDVESIYNRGVAYAETGQGEKAVADWNRILEDDENHFYALMSLGKHFFEQKEYGESAFYYERAYKAKDQSSEAAFQTGRAFHKAGKTAPALKMYDVAIRLDPNMGEAYLYRGALNVYLKKQSSGCADFLKANELGVEEAQSALSNYCG
ncbi:tetratricopeptide repeat protein [Roseivirga sp. BDSF3-8]|uniref:tetratricopeptide repeat protein n=1 Tax=Roseivirga sp. BDSF3-8 TaxID=3241598 RepID=UPI00353192EA